MDNQNLSGKEVGQLLILVVIGIAGFAAWSSMDSKKPPPPAQPPVQQVQQVPSGPQSQQEFSAFLAGYTQKYKALQDADANDLKKSNLRRKRDKELKKRLKGLKGRFTNWSGVIATLQTDSKGDVDALWLNCGSFEVQFSTLGKGIKPTSKLFKVLESVNKGDLITFSFKLEHLEELSLSESGSMLDPEFTGVFTELRLP